ncbi:MAG: hypothetical protein KDC10_05715 [Calditrichaeota bacterium]|nr:hypothetical protein [Candidatus Cloacimonadota bacterium]MCB1046681.1 hypothetical protein [Calditrichota bacterium]MCB9472350.1 hypothetical protein [Candidatus Delongbacteria bacterium]
MPALLILLFTLCLAPARAFADTLPTDTTWVQTFTFDSIATRRAVFPFPPAGQEWRRILMYYKLKCDEATPGDPYPCGEWDVNTYVRVHRHTGLQDSTVHRQARWEVRGEAPDSLALRRQPVYEQRVRWSASRPAAELAKDRYLAFDQGDYLVVPPEALANCGTELTIAFWLRGDSQLQPRNDNLIEACRDTGRALNIHLPWGTGEVYWDAGGYLSGANNRLQKEARPEDWKGRWNHWTFTKNLTTGRMAIWLNGQLWHEAGNMSKPLEPVNQFVIGGNCNGNGGWFAGGIDDFCIYSQELGLTDIQALMAGRMPDRAASTLELYYDFNAPDVQRVIDGGPRGLDARRVGQPRSMAWGSAGAIDLKPAAGARVVRDSLAVDPLAILVYDNPEDPNQPSDTLRLWSAEQRVLDANGNLLETIALPADTLLMQDHRSWTDEYRERVSPLELERFITPYGKGLDLGGDGFTWLRDVSAYAPLLQGEVDLEAHNGYELLDLRFAFLPGPSPRPVLQVEDIWAEGDYGYADLAADRQLPLEVMALRPDTRGAAVRSRISGHGHYGPRNCCEWDAKRHFLAINGIPRFDWTIWTNCGNNPVFPQGGTWQFDRAGWCPGTFVITRDHEITPWVLGDSLCAIDYSIEAPDPSNGEGDGRYVQVHQLLQYGELHARTDLRLEEIIAPSQRDEFRRLNPISVSPRVRVRNLGEAGTQTLRIHYGLQDRLPSQFEWQGWLARNEAVELDLPAPDWSGMQAGSRFEARLETLNGTDGWPADNLLASLCAEPLVLPETVVLQIQCPPFGRAADNRWVLLDEQGTQQAGRALLAEEELARDTLRLAPGAWELHLLDDQEDGMIRHWWLRGSDPEHMGSNGRVLLLSLEGDTLKDLGYDFAEGVSARFFVRD